MSRGEAESRESQTGTGKRDRTGDEHTLIVSGLKGERKDVGTVKMGRLD